MDIQNVLLNLIVFTLPVITGGYIFIGIKLLKQKVDGHYNYFSAIMFFSAVYSLGYFLSLNSLTVETMILARNFENLGVIAIPSCGILYVSQLLKRKLPYKIKYLLWAVSGILWVIYVTNPFHHWAFSQIDLMKINGFAVAATTKGLGYYLISFYYVIFLIYASIELLKAIKITNFEQSRRIYLFYFLTAQTSWIAIIIILTGLDKYLDPTPIVILLLSLIFGYCEVKSMLFRLEIDRWKRNFIKTEEIAFLVNEYNEIVCLNDKASVFFADEKERVHEILKILDHGDYIRKPMEIPIDNDVHWFFININDFDTKRKLTSYMLVDFTEHHQAEAALRESEEKHRLLITQMAQGLAVHEIILDEARKIVDFRYLDANDSYERLTGHKSQDIVGKTALQVNPQMDKAWIQKYGQVAVTGQPIHFDFYDRNVDKYFDIVAYSPRFKQFAVIISDMTERKKAEQEIRYLSYHDYLTGLYNRRFYEEELERLDIPDNLPITLIMADVNGLKLINDSFGHLKGDELLKKAAALICEGAPKGSVIARLGGDEFIVISPQTDIFEAVEIINNMKLKTSNERIDAFDVSISFGYEVKESEDQDIQEIYKRAEDDMYKHKLYESASIKNKTIELIMNTLYEKSGREMRHSRRVSELCKAIAIAMGLTKDAVNQISTAGLMHDIGKMGIDEKILNKEGPLNFEEWHEIQRHPEIGYRILSSSNEFLELAKYVYEHHERWDGKGYPKKLKGSEISIQARIIGVADAYDAMTCDRSYRKGLNQSAAISELRKYIGQQFDPEVTRIFIEKVLMKEN